jgi:hypothetical protein
MRMPFPGMTLGLGRIRNHRGPIDAPFAVAHQQHAPRQVKFLYPQPHGLHQSQAGAVQQPENQTCRSLCAGESGELAGARCSTWVYWNLSAFSPASGVEAAAWR